MAGNRHSSCSCFLCQTSTDDIVEYNINLLIDVSKLKMFQMIQYSTVQVSTVSTITMTPDLSY